MQENTVQQPGSKVPSQQQAQLATQEISETFCSFYWPSDIKKLGFKTKYIQLEDDVISFLSEDGIYIHPKYFKIPSNSTDLDCIDERHKIFSQKFENSIQEVFDEFQSIFIKLNGRAPRDISNWLPNLQITSMEELLTALKSSGIFMDLIEDTIAIEGAQDNNGQQEQQETKEREEGKNDSQILKKDIQEQESEQKQQKKQEFILEIKKWYNIKSNMIVRCFVRENRLIGICQRHCSSVNNILQTSQFSQLITDMFYQKMQSSLSKYINYVYDLYIDIPPNYKLRLIDINPWRQHISPLLFTWEELESLDPQSQKPLIIQTVSSESDVIIEDMSAYRVPEDMLFSGEDDMKSDMANIFDHLNIHNTHLYQ